MMIAAGEKDFLSPATMCFEVRGVESCFVLSAVIK